MKRIAARLLVLHLLLLCLCHQIDARWSRSRFNISPKKGRPADIEGLFDEIRQHKNEESGENFCESQFEEHADTILRTKDSMNDGAAFMKAINLENADACRDQCCHTRENGRHCDLAVFQDSYLDDDSDSSRCFLFSCIDEDGMDHCETATKEDYVVFRGKKKEKDANKLLDILADSAPKPTHAVTKQNLDDCNEGFVVENGFVILPEQSIRNGAVLLTDRSVATSLSTCQSECCQLKSNVSNRYCDFVVFREKFRPLSNKKQQRCFLFSCTDQDGKFLCSTKKDGDYSVSTRVKPLPQNTLSMIRNTSSIQATTSYSISYNSSTAKPVVTTKTQTSTTLSTISPTSPSHSNFNKKCSRLMWQCDNGDCIKVTNVCNGIPNCRDGSDEEGCDVLNDGKIQKSSTFPLSKDILSSPLISSSTQTTHSSRPTESTTQSTAAPLRESPELDPRDSNKGVIGRTEPQKGAVLPLALGLSVTICVLVMVVCRFQLLKRKARRRGKPLSMEESDYLINGMYL